MHAGLLADGRSGVDVLIEQARGIARRWVAENGTAIQGFAGALLIGSALWDPAGAPLSPESDVDVKVVLDATETPPAFGKFIYHDILLEVSFISSRELDSPERVLGDFRLASSISRPGVLADPTGRLTEIHTAVSRHFADRRWVLRRCAQATDVVRYVIARMNPPALQPDQIHSWLLGTTTVTHVLLVAALRDPTTRRRYEATRDLLAAHDRLDYYERLLRLLGCTRLSASRTRHHLAALERVFATAKDVEATSYRFASDISDVARPIAIDGSRRLIERGLHREAAFWLAVTYARCLTKLEVGHADASPYEEAFGELLADLGIETFADRRRRGDVILAALPGLREMAETLAPGSCGPVRGIAWSEPNRWRETSNGIG